MPAETRQPVACAITIDGFVIVPQPKPERRVGVIAHHHPGGLSMAALALMLGRLDRSS